MALNWWAIAVGGVFCFLLGGLWYGFLFMRPWLTAMGINLEDIREVAVPKKSAYAVSAAAGLVLCVVTALFVAWLDLRTVGAGVGLGALAWLGFNGSSFVKLVYWEDRPVALFLIDAGYDLLCFVAVGGLLAGWR